MERRPDRGSAPRLARGAGARLGQRRAEEDAGAAARRPLKRGLVAVAALALAGCASLRPVEPAAGQESLSGRLALRVEAQAGASTRAFSAAFDLRGDSRSGVLALSTPLGSQLGQARWSPAGASLATPRETRAYADVQSMTEAVLGERVPVDAWFDWLHGRPWPGAPSDAGDGGFAQLGWSVDLSRFAAGAVVAVRASPPPAVTVRLQLDRP